TLFPFVKNLFAATAAEGSKIAVCQWLTLGLRRSVGFAPFRSSDAVRSNQNRHCERSEAIQGNAGQPTIPGSPRRFAPRDDGFHLKAHRSSLRAPSPSGGRARSSRPTAPRYIRGRGRCVPERPRVAPARTARKRGGRSGPSHPCPWRFPSVSVSSVARPEATNRRSSSWTPLADRSKSPLHVGARTALRHPAAPLARRDERDIVARSRRRPPAGRRGARRQL